MLPTMNQIGNVTDDISIVGNYTVDNLSFRATFLSIMLSGSWYFHFRNFRRLNCAIPAV